MGERNDAHPRLASRRPEQAADVGRLPLKPGFKTGGSHHQVEPGGEFEAVGCRVEMLELKEAHLGHRRLGNRTNDVAEADRLARFPEGIDDRGEQEMLAAAARLCVDAGQRQDAGGERGDPLSEPFWIFTEAFRWGRQAAEHREWPADAAAGGVDRHVDGVPQPADPLGRLTAGRQAFPPAGGRLLGQLLDAQPIATGRLGIDPGLKVARSKIGKVEQQAAEVALGVDHHRRNAIDGRLFQEPHEQAGLAAAGHSHADRVGCQLLGGQQHWCGQMARCLACGLRRQRINPCAQIKNTQAFNLIGRGNGCGPWILGGSAGHIGPSLGSQKNVASQTESSTPLSLPRNLKAQQPHSISPAFPRARGFKRPTAGG